MKGDRLYLGHMAEAIERILDYTSGGREPFFRKPMIQDAVVRNFEIIGEATKRLSENAKASEPASPRFPGARWLG